jgi:N-methylhydantoinase A
MRLDKQAALAAIRTQIAQPLGIDEPTAASGIYRIATAHMSDLIRKATVERGHDPRNFALFAYGGAAPIHASRYAAQLGIKKVIVPLTASCMGYPSARYRLNTAIGPFIVPVDPARVKRIFQSGDVPAPISIARDLPTNKSKSSEAWTCATVIKFMS